MSGAHTDAPADKTGLVYVGAMDEARVEGQLRSLGLTPDKPVDAELFPRSRFAIAVIDPATLGRGGVAAMQAAVAPLEDTPLVVLAGPCDRSVLAELIALPSVAAIVARDHMRSDSELADALSAVILGPTFDLDREVPPHAKRLVVTVRASPEREATLDQFGAFLADQGVRRRIATTVIDGLEELVTNALYDAPTDAEGRRVYAEIDRRHAVFLGEDARPRVAVTVDGSEVMVTVEDPHGSLELATVRRFLSKGLRAGPDQIDDKLGGAGLGFARVYAMSDRMTVHVERGVRTEVTFALALGGARRDMAARPSGLVLCAR